jgi:hypothetical protein
MRTLFELGSHSFLAVLFPFSFRSDVASHRFPNEQKYSKNGWHKYQLRPVSINPAFEPEEYEHMLVLLEDFVGVPASPQREGVTRPGLIMSRRCNLYHRNLRRRHVESCRSSAALMIAARVHVKVIVSVMVQGDAVELLKGINTLDAGRCQPAVQGDAFEIHRP